MVQAHPHNILLVVNSLIVDRSTKITVTGSASVHVVTQTPVFRLQYTTIQEKRKKNKTKRQNDPDSC